MFYPNKQQCCQGTTSALSISMELNFPGIS